MMKRMEGMSRKSDMTSMLAEKSKGSSDDYSLSAVVLTRSSGTTKSTLDELKMIVIRT